MDQDDGIAGADVSVAQCHAIGGELLIGRGKERRRCRGLRQQRRSDEQRTGNGNEDTAHGNVSFSYFKL
jgi:hypothetical protein